MEWSRAAVGPPTQWEGELRAAWAGRGRSALVCIEPHPFRPVGEIRRRDPGWAENTQRTINRIHTVWALISPEIQKVMQGTALR